MNKMKKKTSVPRRVNKEQKDIFTVSEVSEKIKKQLQPLSAERLSVIGEISNLKGSKGHLYFTLKDDSASISVVVWNYETRLYMIDLNKLENGKKIQANGYITMFTKSGSYNLNAYDIELIGVGNLHQEYQFTKLEYEELGYFDDAKKKPLPKIINKIGVITAVDGAALQDFLYVLNKNGFGGGVIINGCTAQGKDCPRTVISALQELDIMGLDVIIITRGGGSFEDLFGFSDRGVVEAIYKAKTPIISAIGHEVDFMLSDFVADIRAPTPSIAADLVSTHQKKMIDLDAVNNLCGHLTNILMNKLNEYEHTINKITHKLQKPENQTEKDLYNLINEVKNELDSRLLLYETLVSSINIPSQRDILLKTSSQLTGLMNSLEDKIFNKIYGYDRIMNSIKVDAPKNLIIENMQRIRWIEDIIDNRLFSYEKNIDKIENIINATYTLALTSGGWLFFDDEGNVIKNQLSIGKKLKVQNLDTGFIYEIKILRKSNE